MKIPTKKNRKIMMISSLSIFLSFVILTLILRRKFEISLLLIIIIGYLTPYIFFCDKEDIFTNKKK